MKLKKIPERWTSEGWSFFAQMYDPRRFIIVSAFQSWSLTSNRCWISWIASERSLITKGPFRRGCIARVRAGLFRRPSSGREARCPTRCCWTRPCSSRPGWPSTDDEPWTGTPTSPGRQKWSLYILRAWVLIPALLASLTAQTSAQWLATSHNYMCSINIFKPLSILL